MHKRTTFIFRELSDVNQERVNPGRWFQSCIHLDTQIEQVLTF